MSVLNLKAVDLYLQQSCVTLIAKIKSEVTLRLRKLEKTQFVVSEHAHQTAKVFSEMSNR